jgi:exosortase/archaeosortase family protein
MAVLLGAVVIAYNYSLTTLWQLADLNTPLAYVSLVPVIALVLAAVHSRPLQPEPAIHDRQTDYIIGLPLMGAALFTMFLLPAKLSAMFWVWRIDLLTLPFFVSGAVAVIFGVRVLWRQKFAVGFLFLAWPFPYTSVLLGLLNAFTSATLFGIARILGIFHIATPIPSLDNTAFTIVHNGHPFSLSVVSACSGVSSVVGFLLVGSAFAAIVRGPMIRKVLWLLGGMILLWMINLGRIILIFWVGQHYGEPFAINVLHPFIGLVTFTCGVGIMILCMKPLGLRIGDGDLWSSGIQKSPVRGTQEQLPTETHTLAVPRVYVAVVIVLVIGLLLGLSNLNLKSYNLVANVAGQSKLISYIDGPVTPLGWTGRYETTFNWAEPLFGENSTWNRYEFSPSTGGNLHAQTDIVADVIDTPDLATFSAFGIEQCYQFHGYSLADISQVSLGGGVTGQALAFTSQQYGSWSIVYWILPVIHGASTYFERVVLYVQNQKGLIAPATEGQQSEIRNISGSLSADDPKQLILLQNRAFLVAYARELINTQADRSARLIAQSTTT